MVPGLRIGYMGAHSAINAGVIHILGQRVALRAGSVAPVGRAPSASSSLVALTDMLALARTSNSR